MKKVKANSAQFKIIQNNPIEIANNTASLASHTAKLASHMNDKKPQLRKNYQNKTKNL